VCSLFFVIQIFIHRVRWRKLLLLLHLPTNSRTSFFFLAAGVNGTFKFSNSNCTIGKCVFVYFWLLNAPNYYFSFFVVINWISFVMASNSLYMCVYYVCIIKEFSCFVSMFPSQIQVSVLLPFYLFCI
jgi:hypothetical protein